MHSIESLLSWTTRHYVQPAIERAKTAGSHLKNTCIAPAYEQCRERVEYLRREYFQPAVVWSTQRYSEVTANGLKPLFDRANETQQQAAQAISSAYKKVFIPPQVPPDSLLTSDDPASNLSRLTNLTASTAFYGVGTPQAVRTLPLIDRISAGYPNRESLRTDIGDMVITTSTAVALATTITGTFLNALSCVMEEPIDNEHATEECTSRAFSDILTPASLAVLTGGALILANTVLAHRVGALGAILHDRNGAWRAQHLRKVYRNAADELYNSNDLQKAHQIDAHLPLIKANLMHGMQLDHEEVEAIVGELHWACNAIRKKHSQGETAQ